MRRTKGRSVSLYDNIMHEHAPLPPGKTAASLFVQLHNDTQHDTRKRHSETLQSDDERAELQ
jgi:hypothetical protein